jgi:glutamate-1-semialdehyde 2,1-aminomutase
MEAAMMNVGVILPVDGYLAKVREITTRHNVVWIVDEVKTGLTIAAGGACEYFSIAPDMVCLAKALGAGLPTGAIGMTSELADEIVSGRVRHVGTFSGNPLAMAAARVSMERVLTADAYARLGQLETILLEGVREAMRRHRLPGSAVGIRSKGVALLGASAPITDFVSWAENLDPKLNRLAWLYGVNRGIYTAPGRDEEWTLSVAHSEDDVRRYIGVFEELCAELAA